MQKPKKTNPNAKWMEFIHRKKVEPDPALCVDGFNKKPKRQGEDYNSTEDKERWEAELVKLIQSVILGDFVNILEPSIQGIVAEEFSMSLEADSYQRSAKRTNYRNVYRERKVPIVTEIGPVNISIPKGKKGVSIR